MSEKKWTFAHENFNWDELFIHKEGMAWKYLVIWSEILVAHNKGCSERVLKISSLLEQNYSGNFRLSFERFDRKYIPISAQLELFANFRQSQGNNYVHEMIETF